MTLQRFNHNWTSCNPQIIIGSGATSSNIVRAHGSQFFLFRWILATNTSTKHPVKALNLLWIRIYIGEKVKPFDVQNEDL